MKKNKKHQLSVVILVLLLSLAFHRFLLVPFHPLPSHPLPPRPLPLLLIVIIIILPLVLLLLLIILLLLLLLLLLHLLLPVIIVRLTNSHHPPQKGVVVRLRLPPPTSLHFSAGNEICGRLVSRFSFFLREHYFMSGVIASFLSGVDHQHVR